MNAQAVPLFPPSIQQRPSDDGRNRNVNCCLRVFLPFLPVNLIEHYNCGRYTASDPVIQV